MIKSRLQCWRLEFDPWVRKILWRRKWQPTPVFLPGESHGLRSLAGYSPGVAKSQTRLPTKHNGQLGLLGAEPLWLGGCRVHFSQSWWPRGPRSRPWRRILYLPRFADGAFLPSPAAGGAGSPWALSEGPVPARSAAAVPLDGMSPRLVTAWCRPALRREGGLSSHRCPRGFRTDPKQSVEHPCLHARI